MFAKLAYCALSFLFGAAFQTGFLTHSFSHPRLGVERSAVVRTSARVLNVVPMRVRARLQPISLSSRSLSLSHPVYRGTVRTRNGSFSAINAMAYDSANGDLIVAEGGAIFLVNSNGVATQLTTLSPGFLGLGLVYDPTTKLIYAALNSEIDAISPVDGTTTLLAGGTYGMADGTGAFAQFQYPQGIAIDATGKVLYVTDNDRIRKVTVSGVVTTVTAPGAIAPIRDCSGQEGIAFDTHDGNLYISDSCADVIYRTTPATGVTTTFAGTCISTSFQCQQEWNDGIGAQALFATPLAITYNCVDGSLYIVDGGNNDVRRLQTNRAVTTLAGSGRAEELDGVGAAAGFAYPLAMTINHNGLLYVADGDFGTGISLVRSVTTLGPQAPPPPHGVLLFNPASLTANAYSFTTTRDGSLWYSEPSVYKIARIFPNGHTVEYSVPTTYAPLDLHTDSQGDIWYGGSDYPTNPVMLAMGELSQTGAVQIFPLPEQEQAGFTIAGDGNVWFMPFAGLGRMTENGTVVEFVSDPAFYIATGFSGDIWTSDSGYVEETSTSAVLLKKYSSTLLTQGPLARGPHNHMWLGQDNAIAEVLPSTVLLYTLPPVQFESWAPSTLVEGADGALWFASPFQGSIGRLTTDGTFTPYQIPAPRSAPHSVIVAPNGMIWFTDPGAAKIGRIY